MAGYQDSEVQTDIANTVEIPTNKHAEAQAKRDFLKENPISKVITGKKNQTLKEANEED